MSAETVTERMTVHMPRCDILIATLVLVDLYF